MSKLRLTEFNIADPLVGENGRPTVAFHRWIIGVIKSIQTSVNDLDQVVRDIAESLRQAGIAVRTAGEAKAAALAQVKDQALVNSYVSPSDVLSSAIDPNDATKAIITVDDHVRQYGDGTNVGVGGATIPNAALETVYYITYLDPDREGGIVTYTISADPLVSGQGNDRHLVGTIMTPASGATEPNTGDPTYPPGVPRYRSNVEVAQ